MCTGWLQLPPLQDPDLSGILLDDCAYDIAVEEPVVDHPCAVPVVEGPRSSGDGLGRIGDRKFAQPVGNPASIGGPVMHVKAHDGRSRFEDASRRTATSSLLQPVL